MGFLLGRVQEACADEFHLFRYTAQQGGPLPEVFVAVHLKSLPGALEGFIYFLYGGIPESFHTPKLKTTAYWWLLLLDQLAFEVVIVSPGNGHIIKISRL